MIPPRKAADPAREAPMPEPIPQNPSPSARFGRLIWAFIQRLRGG